MKEMSLVSVVVERGEEGMRDLLVSPCLICVFVVGFQFSNSLIASRAWTSCLSTHSLSESGYPFHLIRYCFLRLLLKCHESRIFSTSYSSSLSTRSISKPWGLYQALQ